MEKQTDSELRQPSLVSETQESPQQNADACPKGIFHRFAFWNRVDFKSWKQKGQAFLAQLKELLQGKHRFAVMDAHTFREKFSFQLSGITIFTTVGSIMILLVLLTTVLIVFTPLREYIPGYSNSDLIEQSYHNAVVIDSLEHQVRYQEWMISNIQDVLSGKEMVTAEEAKKKSDSLASLGVSTADYVRSRSDSLLRIYVEENDKHYQVRVSPLTKQSTLPKQGESLMAHGLFFTPMQGYVVAPYDSQIRHFGVDVAGVSNSLINAIYGGTVVFSNFTVETGYIVAVQHPDDVLSVYKHCSKLLKQEGDVVLAGEPLAYLGNSGSLSTGPHLHFELWMKGKPVDPKQYVLFMDSSRQ